ncbi:hypothetical protein LOC68_14470 [Blastopirellula sp. JC732]|uniref:Uncharacterized protein n=1 Tax=Blastopirellula sediminis TaxID=2894196 RepID=A0A9X1SKC5_9BACT|nr:hypothetical protein [Blastopirellula sediminis]MCC9607113.1 hypothetical protein [Blastopirellula sediminis]MCC9629594.1 hypothetical protein [Blastopirellula sediminis]
MNAIALVLCTVALGADARDTIPNVKALSALIDRTYDIDQINHVDLVGDGSWLQTSGNLDLGSPGLRGTIPQGMPMALYRNSLLIDKYQLWVVSCPSRPSMFLAGYVRFDSETLKPYELTGITEKSLKTAFCVLLDVDQNVVIKLDEPAARLYLDEARHEALSAGMNVIWDNYLQRIASQPKSAPFVDKYLDFQKQFVSPPPITATAQTRFTRSRDKPEERFNGVYVTITFSADGCEANHSASFDVSKLLDTSVAVPAVKYFTAPQNAGKEVE